MSKDPINSLVDQSRTLGPSRVIRDPDAAAVTVDQARAVVAAFQAFKLRTNVSNAYAARSIGVSPTTFCDVLQLRYKGNWQDVILDLDRWLEDERRRDESPRPVDFAWTSVAEEVLAAAEAAVELRTISVVYGDTGIGKTLALRAVAAEKPGSVFVSVETMAATASGLVDAIGRQLRAATGARYSSSRYVLDRVKELLRGTSRLLSGTTDLVAYLERRQTGGREPLGQIRSRIGIRRDLNERAAAAGTAAAGARRGSRRTRSAARSPRARCGSRRTRSGT